MIGNKTTHSCNDHHFSRSFGYRYYSAKPGESLNSIYIRISMGVKMWILYKAILLKCRRGFKSWLNVLTTLRKKNPAAFKPACFLKELTNVFRPIAKASYTIRMKLLL